jgi:hypothetical protein
MVVNEYNYAYFSHMGKVEAMNYSTAVFLINSDVRAVYVIMEPEKRDLDQRRYMVKTFDRAINVDDYVVVPASVGHNLAIAKVVAVDVEVDFDATTEVMWIVDKIDVSEFMQTVEQEKKAVAQIKQAHFTDTKRKLAESLLSNKALMKALPLASKPRDSNG